MRYYSMSRIRPAHNDSRTVFTQPTFIDAGDCRRGHRSTAYSYVCNVSVMRPSRRPLSTALIAFGVNGFGSALDLAVNGRYASKVIIACKRESALRLQTVGAPSWPSSP